VHRDLKPANMIINSRSQVKSSTSAWRRWTSRAAWATRVAKRLLHPV
jgi:serine/threonine protein kinase